MATLNIKNFPDELHGRLKQRADREHRSLSQEVIHLLSRAVDSTPRSILDLKGLGKERWEGEEAVSHVARERSSWD